MPIGPGIYRVQREDTLFAISRRSNISLRDLIEANDLQPPFLLTTGQTIRIPAVRYHTVSAGETLYGISREYSVAMNLLVRTNDLSAPYHIRVGQRLRIPAERSEPARTAGSGGKNEAATTRVTAPRPPDKSGAADTRIARRPASKPPPRSGSRFAWPAEGRVLSGFGPKKSGLHNDGINIAVRAGTPVRAADNGVVAYAGNELRGFGNLLLLRHDGGWVTAYAHMSEVTVRVGDVVRRGQVVARAGGTGNVDRPQLHFEIRRGNRAVDPLRHLDRKSADADRRETDPS